MKNVKEALKKTMSCIRERRVPWRVEQALRKIVYRIRSIGEWLRRFFLYKLMDIRVINMDKEKFLNYFDRTYHRRLTESLAGGKPVNRHIGFRKIFEELLNKKGGGFTIVETGTLRDEERWADGQSSLLFFEFISLFGGKLVSIDIDEGNIRACKRALLNRIPKSRKAELVLVVGNSIEELNKIDESVDLLYLDSYDLDKDNPAPAMVHHLKELVSAGKIINKSKGLLIATDDNLEGAGKGKYVMEWARGTHQEILLENYQTLIKVTCPEKSPEV